MLKTPKDLTQRIVGIAIVLLIACLLCIILPLYLKKSDKKDLTLTETEKKYVGTWELEDISITSFYGVAQSYQQWYPSSYSNEYAASASAFNAMCKKYYGKTKFTFDDKKITYKENDSFSREGINGSLTIGSNTISFYWCGEEGNQIKIKNSTGKAAFQFDAIYEKDKVTSCPVFSASINTQNKLIISVKGSSSNQPSHLVQYIFKK